MQRKWYRSVLEKDIDAVNGLTGKKEGKTRLMNLVMQVGFFYQEYCYEADCFPISSEKLPAILTSSMAPNPVHHTPLTNIWCKTVEK